MSKSFDEALSQETADRVQRKGSTSFEKAYQAVLITEGALYIQGFLVVASSPSVPIEHAWIEVGDRIVDPTLPALLEQGQEFYYFPAQCLTVKQLQATVEESKEDYPDDDPLPIYGAAPYEYYGEVMLGGKDYQQAYTAAVEKCITINREIAEQN